MRAMPRPSLRHRTPEQPRPRYLYAACRRRRVVHRLKMHVGPPWPRNGKRAASLLCTRELTFIGDVFEEFDHDHERFCDLCRGATVAKHFTGCDAALDALPWTDEELPAIGGCWIGSARAA